MSKPSFQSTVEKRYNIDRDDKIAKRLANMPSSCRGAYKKAVAHKSMRSAINSQCVECMGYVRKEVSVCSDLGCPLYSYRPFQKRAGGNDMPADFSGEAILDPLCAAESKNSVL